jgi:hypothetical protein
MPCQTSFDDLAVCAEKLSGRTLRTFTQLFKAAVLNFANLASFLAYRALRKYVLSRIDSGVLEGSRSTALTEQVTVWSTTRFSASKVYMLREQELHRAYMCTSALGTIRVAERKSVPLHRTSRHVGIDIMILLKGLNESWTDCGQ